MRWLSLKLLAAVVLLTLVGTGSYAVADSITRSFIGKSDIKSGQVVALSKSDKNTVELARADDPTHIYGVVVEQSAAPVTLQQPGQNVFVATSGAYPVFVSTENGAIAAGDYLSMSSDDGIVARIKNQTFVIGRASQNFDGQSGSLGSGKNGSVIGKISVQVAPGKNPQLREDTTVPALLRKLGESIAGKPLSASRIYAALVIFIITAGTAFGLLWVGVRSGMVAIGRNPLGKHSIMQNLAQVIVASGIVFVGGLFGIYLLLRI
ncbi:MAG: hypothetical protein AAB896_02235 [Patescibacteria group bacterium]